MTPLHLRESDRSSGRGPLEILAETWLEGRRARGELAGRSGYVEGRRLAGLLAVHGSRPVVELDRPTLLAWQATIGHCSPATRRSYLSTVGNFTRWLVLEGHLPVDPALGLAKVREPRRVPRALSADDIARVLGACRDARGRAVVWLMVGCGLRCVEVARLDVDDYDRSSSTIQVRGKAGNERVLPLPQAVTEALNGYLAGRGYAAGPLFRPDPRGKGTSGRLTAGWVSRMVALLMVDAGVHSPGDRRTAHALRHTAASDVLDACHDLRVVQEMLGHASLATTQIYLRRADLGKMRQAMEGRTYETRVA